MLIQEIAHVNGRMACRKTYEDAFQFIKGQFNIVHSGAPYRMVGPQLVHCAYEISKSEHVILSLYENILLFIRRLLDKTEIYDKFQEISTTTVRDFIVVANPSAP